MPTRFYLPSTGTPSITPAVDAGWSITTNFDRVSAVISRISSAMASKTTANSGVANSILNRQYISPPLSAQTISGTIKGQLRGSESNNQMDATPALSVRVVNSTGDTVRGTLMALNWSSLTAANEYTTSLVNRNHLVSTAISSLSVQDGDRIVIEIGARQHATSPNRNVTQSFGDDSATDLAEDQTTATAHNPWIELSGNLTFRRINVNQLMMAGN